MAPVESARQRLSTRIVGLFLGLLLLVQGAGFIAIRASIDRNARGTLAQELEVGERIWKRLLEQKSQALAQGAALLAADFGFRSAVAAGDEDTLQSALENQGARIGASISAWVDASLQVRAAQGMLPTPESQERLRALAGELARDSTGRRVALLDGRAYQFVAVPMKAPLTIGWMVLGFALDQALLEDMRALSGLHVALLVPRALGPARIKVSTLDARHAAALEAVGRGEMRIDDEDFVVRAVSLAGGMEGAKALLLRSVDEAVAPYRQLQWMLALITAFGVAIFGVGSLMTARHVTTPLRALVRATQRLGQGDYSEAVASTGRRDEIGELAGAFDQMRQNIASHAAEVRQLAYWDKLTGLPNRVQFREALQQAIIGSHAGGQLAVVMFDLDRFKHVNDVLGYALGDRLLAAVAGRVTQEVVREGDVVARLTGDKFALLLPGVDATEAVAVARRIAGAFERPLQLEEQTVDVSAGFGIACWPQHAADADLLLGRAELAMYTAKRKTIGSVVYDSTIDSGSAQTLSLLSELRQALERNELRLFLQPKMALADGTLIGAEALVRWQHPTRGMVPPLHFIPFAEQTGFVRALTLWIFAETARQWPLMQACGLQRVSVNLSTRDLMDPDLPAALDRILQPLGVPRSVFCLEITESAIMDDPQRAEATLNALSAAGFKLSIDDFGTGYSSLAYLKRLPVNELKIDKSFVMAMERDADDAKIVRSTIDLAHNLGLTVVAEGVENAAVWNLLKALRCDEGQGYHMSKPLPAQELPAFARRWAERLHAGTRSVETA